MAGLYDPYAAPIFPAGGAFGTGSPAETAQQPSGLDWMMQSISRLFGGAPPQEASPQTVYPTANPLTAITDQDLNRGLGLGMAFSGGGLSVRPYRNVPDSLMGYRKSGPQRGFDEGNYPHTQGVEVTLPATSYSGRDTFLDEIRGMNADHALERAWRNWPNALNIRALINGR